MEENIMSSEINVINKVILDMRQDIIEIVDEYYSTRSSADTLDIEVLKNKTADEILTVFMRIANRIGRFSEYKSKIKIMKRGDKLTDKEKDRCDFVLRVNGSASISILKNAFSEVTGTFTRKAKK